MPLLGWTHLRNVLAFLTTVSGFAAMSVVLLEFVIVRYFFMIDSEVGGRVYLGLILACLFLLLAAAYALLQVTAWLADGEWPTFAQRPSLVRRLLAGLGAAVWFAVGAMAARHWRETGPLAVAGSLGVIAIYCVAIGTAAVVGLRRMRL